MKVAQSLSKKINTRAACKALGIPTASYYRRCNPKTKNFSAPVKPPLALSGVERQAVLNILHSERFVDRSPAEVFATLLDEGTYLCSERTMYRILASQKEVRERRKCKRNTHAYKKPELLATKPNQVWSWDITKLKGAQKWSYYHLYVILDIYSRYVVGWMVADRESSTLAKQLISETCEKQDIKPHQLTLHADRGSSMKSKCVAHLLSDMGITKTHSRPYTSDDNPFSESQFKTLKYCPEFPERFGCIEDARTFCRAFFRWYNNEHRHSGINMITPRALHYGMADAIINKRNEVYEKAFEQHKSRFKNIKPSAGEIPREVWINPPQTTSLAQEASEKVV